MKCFILVADHLTRNDIYLFTIHNFLFLSLCIREKTILIYLLKVTKLMSLNVREIIIQWIFNICQLTLILDSRKGSPNKRLFLALPGSEEQIFTFPPLFDFETFPYREFAPTVTVYRYWSTSYILSQSFVQLI